MELVNLAEVNVLKRKNLCLNDTWKQTHFVNHSADIDFRGRNILCHDTCCVQERPYNIKSYQPELVNTTMQPSVQDRIGIYETMSYIPDVYYNCGETDVKNLNHIFLTPELIPCLQPGTIILVAINNVAKFFEEVFPLLKEPFVLFTMNTDASAPGQSSIFVQRNGTKSLLIHWYSANCDAADENLEIFTCMPMGLAHGNNQKHVLHQLFSTIDGLTYRQGQPVFPKKIEEKRQGLVLVSFRSSSGGVRHEPWAHMCQNRDLWKNETVLCKQDFETLEQLYEASLTFKFIISPHGMGLDCYRTWEGLFLGMIPVVKSSTIDSLYRGLPVLIVQEWTDVTPELLHRSWEAFQHQRFDFSRLYVSYWQFEMSKYRENPAVAFEYSLRK